MSGAPEGYVEVAERIEKFYAKYPKGSLRCKEIRSVEIAGKSYLVYVAQAFRTPDDEAPAEGSAWEPVPGQTNFTRDSELMNAETSAWGRAIAALGFEVKRGIASANEVRPSSRSNGKGPRIKAERVNRIGKAIGTAGLTYKQIDVLLGSCGVDGLRAGSGKALRERLESLSAEQADALEAEMGTDG